MVHIKLYICSEVSGKSLLLIEGLVLGLQQLRESVIQKGSFMSLSLFCNVKHNFRCLEVRTFAGEEISASGLCTGLSAESEADYIQGLLLNISGVCTLIWLN